MEGEQKHAKHNVKTNIQDKRLSWTVMTVIVIRYTNYFYIPIIPYNQILTTNNLLSKQKF